MLQRLREGSHGGEIDEPDARERTPMLSVSRLGTLQYPLGLILGLTRFLDAIQTSAPVPQGNGIAKTEIAELDSILATLPNKAVCDILVDSFFTRVDWYLHVSAFSSDLSLAVCVASGADSLAIPTNRSSTSLRSRTSTKYFGSGSGM